MDEYNVKILSPAQLDILDLVDNLNTMPPETAIQYYDQLTEQIGALTKSPESYPLARDTQFRLRGYRTMQFNDYTVFFAIRGRNVEIRRVLYSKKQYERLY